MLTDKFLNMSCLVAVTDTIEFTPKLASDCYDILNFYSTGGDDSSIPIAYQVKFNLAKTLCKMRAQAIPSDVVLEQVRAGKKYNDLDSFLVGMEAKGKKLDKASCKSVVEQIEIKKKLISSIGNFSKLKDFVDKFESNGYESADEALDAYEKTIESLYGSWSVHKRNKMTSQVQSLDLLEGDYTPALDMISKNNSGVNVLPTGYFQLDKYLKGGLQPGRLYIFAGTSNDGKSTLLMNLINNQISQDRRVDEEKDDIDIYLYVTLENLIDESLLRLYCTSEKVTFDEALANWEEIKKTLPETMRKKQKDKKAAIMMHFFPGTSISVYDIEKLIEDTNEKYKGRGIVKGVFIDYLDLVTSGKSFDIYRLEVGQVAMDMKILAVTQQIPVCTVTQLNRSAYEKTENRLSLNMMSESIKKVDHADVVALLRALPLDGRLETSSDDINSVDDHEIENGKMLIFIGKNRSGPKDKKVELRTDFSKYSISNFDESSVVSMANEYSSVGSDTIRRAFEVPTVDGITLDNDIVTI